MGFKKHKPLFAVLLTALVIRLLYFFVNWKWGPSPIWYSLAQCNLVSAEHFMNVSSSALTCDLAEALEFFKSEARGGSILLMGFIWLFGKASLWQPAFIQIPLDVATIYFVYEIARKLSDEKIAGWSAWIYCFFPYTVWATLHPAWYTFANSGLCIFVWSVLKASEYKGLKRYIFPSVIGISSLYLVAQFRSNTVLMPYFFFGACLVGAVLIPSYLRKWTLIVFLAVGLGTSVLHLVTNYKLGGDLTLTRTHWGHSFLMGVGQSSNEYAVQNHLDSSDSSVVDFYFRDYPEKKVGWNNHHIWTDKNYIEWSKRKSSEFVKAYPFVYGKMVLQRQLQMLFPMVRLSFFADTDAVALNEAPAARDERLSIVKTGLKYTPGGQWILFKNHTAYFFEFWLRIFAMIFFSGGILAALFMARKEERSLTFFLLIPLVYVTLSTSLIRLPNFDHMYLGWLLLMPAVMLGWSLIVKKIYFLRTLR